jgi:hypothetical protein
VDPDEIRHLFGDVGQGRDRQHPLLPLLHPFLALFTVVTLLIPNGFPGPGNHGTGKGERQSRYDRSDTRLSGRNLNKWKK